MSAPGTYGMENAVNAQGLGGVHDALNRMRRAAERGTGCHLTADMIASLAVTIIGQTWSETDPRDAQVIGGAR